jgi:Flp pilus assembly protein TadG
MEDEMATNGGRARSRRRCKGDGGVALVEFAIVAPLFFMLIFGVIEFGWAFYQHLDVRHGAREGARLAAVNYKTTANPTAAEQVQEIVDELCDRMDSGNADIDVQITRTGAAVGDELTVHVSKDLDTITGFFDPIIGDIDIDESVTSRLEQNASWQSMTSAVSC